MHQKTKTFMRLSMLRYSLYCSGLESNLQLSPRDASDVSHISKFFKLNFFSSHTEKGKKEQTEIILIFYLI